MKTASRRRVRKIDNGRIPDGNGDPRTPRQKIEREWFLFGTVIQAQSEMNRFRRSAYFYKREAIVWAHEALCALRGGFTLLPYEKSLRLAKSYLAQYRQAKAVMS